MTKKAAIQQFKKDYCKMQLIWSTFVDSLCKGGEITQRQYDTWLAPFQK